MLQFVDPMPAALNRTACFLFPDRGTRNNRHGPGRGFSPRLLILILFIIFLLSQGGPASAYFQEHQSQDLWTADEDSPRWSKNGTHHLGLFVAVRGSGNALKAHWDFLPVSTNRIPLDAIDCNPPVIIGLTRQPSTLDVSLQTLLYADLKLKKLLEEFAHLQERAQTLLGRNDQTNKEQPAFFKNKEKDDSTSQGRASISRKMQLLEAQRRYESRQFLLARPKDTHVQHFESLFTRSLASLEESAKKSSQSLESMVTGILAYGESIDGQDSLRPQSLTAQQSITLRNEDESELPWVFQRLIVLIGYVFSHKLEAAAYALCLAVLAGVVLSLRKA